VLLQVVTLAGDVGADLDPVRQADTGDLAQRRVRLLGGRRRDARADTALLRGSRERRRLRLGLLRRAALADELIDGRHAEADVPFVGGSCWSYAHGWSGEHAAAPTEPAGHSTETARDPPRFGPTRTWTFFRNFGRFSGFRVIAPAPGLTYSESAAVQ